MNSVTSPLGDAAEAVDSLSDRRMEVAVRVHQRVDKAALETRREERRDVVRAAAMVVKIKFIKYPSVGRRGAGVWSELHKRGSPSMI